MPTFRHGKNTAILYSQYNLSSFLNEVSSSTEVETGETTAFGQNSKTYVVGLNDGTMSASGLFEATSTAGSEGVDPVISASLGSDTDGVLTYAMSGLTVGQPAKIAAVQSTSYEVSSPVGDVVSISAEFQANGGIQTGLILASGTVSTATTTNGTAQDNAASSANGGVANFHVTANANGGSTTLKVQHSADNSTWADLSGVTITAGANTRTSGRVAVSGTVNRYVRGVAVTASTGAITYHIAFARN